MEHNVGNFDRLIRLLLGLLIIMAGFYYSNWLGLLGLVPLLTAAFGWCPLYSLLGISTCKECQRKMDAQEM